MMKKGCCSTSSYDDCMTAEKLVKSGSEVVQNGGSSSSDMKNKMKERLCYGDGARQTASVTGMAAVYDADQLISSWPPRHYTCSFCRRRFKSAQALGGHMNVHRRARALLRSQSISPISSPPSSPWLPTSTSSAHHQLHGDDPNFIAASPNPNNYSLSIPSQSNLLHLPKMNITSSCSSTFPHKMMMMPLPVVAPACLNSQKIRYHSLGSGSTELITSAGERAEKNCIRADQHSLKGLTMTHQGLILNTGLVTRSANEEDEIDLELRLGY